MFYVLGRFCQLCGESEGCANFNYIILSSHPKYHEKQMGFVNWLTDSRVHVLCSCSILSTLRGMRVQLHYFVNLCQAIPYILLTNSCLTHQFLGSADPGAFPLPHETACDTPACPASGKLRGHPHEPHTDYLRPLPVVPGVFKAPPRGTTGI